MTRALLLPFYLSDSLLAVQTNVRSRAKGPQGGARIGHPIKIKTLFFSLCFIVLQTARLAGQSDSVPPVLMCKTGVVDFPTYLCNSLLFPSNVIDTVYDDNGPVELGLRKVCTGTGFPSKADLWVGEVGLILIEAWARDAAGNTSTCTTQILAYDSPGVCDGGYDFQTITHDSLPLSNCSIHSESHSFCYADSRNHTFNTGNLGIIYLFGFITPTAGYDLSVTPAKTGDPLNGVSALDLVRIQKHLLGLEPFTEPWQFIAADANQDGQVSTFDVVILWRLLLGLTQELPNGKSWRFYPENYQFPGNTVNPLLPAFPEAYIEHVVEKPPVHIRFVGVKIGDLTGDANTN